MPIQHVNVGQAPDDGTGDPYRTAMQKLNASVATLDGEKANAVDVVTELGKKVDKIAGKGLSTNDYTNALKIKLDGIADQATKNQTDAYLLSRANHTGTQAISTVAGLQTALDTKVAETSVGSLPAEVPSNQHLGAVAFTDTIGATQVTQHVRDSQPGDVWHEWVSNTQLKKKFHGLDGVIRTITETYA